MEAQAGRVPVESQGAGRPGRGHRRPKLRLAGCSPAAELGGGGRPLDDGPSADPHKRGSHQGPPEHGREHESGPVGGDQPDDGDGRGHPEDQHPGRREPQEQAPGGSPPEADGGGFGRHGHGWLNSRSERAQVGAREGQARPVPCAGGDRELPRAAARPGRRRRRRPGAGPAGSDRIEEPAASPVGADATASGASGLAGGAPSRLRRPPARARPSPAQAAPGQSPGPPRPPPAASGDGSRFAGPLPGRLAGPPSPEAPASPRSSRPGRRSSCGAHRGHRQRTDFLGGGHRPSGRLRSMSPPWCADGGTDRRSSAPSSAPATGRSRPGPAPTGPKPPAWSSAVRSDRPGRRLWPAFPNRRGKSGPGSVWKRSAPRSPRSSGAPRRW